MKKTRLGAKTGQRGIIKKNNMCASDKPVPRPLYNPHPHRLPAHALSNPYPGLLSALSYFQIYLYTYRVYICEFTFVHITGHKKRDRLFTSPLYSILYDMLYTFTYTYYLAILNSTHLYRV